MTGERRTGFLRLKIFDFINVQNYAAVYRHEPVTENDPSPTGDLTTCYPDQHDCPLACKDYANIHISQPLDDANSTTLIRNCTLEAHDEDVVVAAGVRAVENPKKDNKLYQPSLESAPAGASGSGIRKTEDEVQFASQTPASSGNRSRLHAGEAAHDAGRLLEGMHNFFRAEDNCGETFLFAQQNETVVAIYIGDAMGKATVDLMLQALTRRISANATMDSHTVAELCGSGRASERSFIVAITTTGDLTGVQKTSLAWSKGNCVALRETEHWEPLAGPHDDRSRARPRSPEAQARRPGAADGTCATHLIVSGDTCDKLARQYIVSINDLEKWNKGKTWAWTECKDMLIGYNINWGFCGVFPGYCDIHALPGGSPGTKEKGFQNIFVANCNNGIKQNSGPPAKFQRIGYYESFDFARLLASQG
ncbi:hypothetical protein B0J11DRAFT_591820 [Dendryphion nanum]|uniref:LysM domain-containing protein n=1 Tax=Dendryphion nanum TaxID=256645 RepID=A0A9P9IDE4_9PLEO|nr:hypothetical protein B0J11DRAFT_591820 [Dendryphion nanum]